MIVQFWQTNCCHVMPEVTPGSCTQVPITELVLTHQHPLPLHGSDQQLHKHSGSTSEELSRGNRIKLIDGMRTDSVGENEGNEEEDASQSSVCETGRKRGS